MDDFSVSSDGPQFEPAGSPRTPFFTERKVLAFLVVAAAFGLIIGIARVRGTIGSAFSNTSTEINTQQEELSARLLALAEKDTDQDGLNDFVELYQTGTSPYLRDSDSDGIDDLVEIDAGSNPNCPEGQDCQGFISEEQLAEQNQDTTTEETTNPVTDETNVTAAAIRETLKNSGAPEYLLEATSDEELLSIYTEVSGEAQSTTSDGAGTLETLQAFTPDDIREFLVSTGADATLLEEVSDDDLYEIFQQALDEESSLFTSETGQ